MKIDKERLIEQLKNSEQFNAPIPKWVWGVIEGMKEIAGEWVNDVAYYDEEGCPCIVTRCNQCGGAYPAGNYCPGCGAKMEGVKE